MSDTSKPTKISREGVILIKSFEGFRPRAIQRADGRWTIGYGHTQSAREGLTVSESDAELLLQYDLIPVAQTVKAIEAPLNQHQFDALASFAFSVGVDRFKTSDVLARLNAGAPLEAANALMTWIDDADVVTPPRRRAAERALFVADPTVPASLADLLAAPLPPPTAILVDRTDDPDSTPAEAEAEFSEPEPFPVFAPSPPEVETAAEAPSAMTREAAVSALLGEVEGSPAATLPTVEPAPPAAEPVMDPAITEEAAAFPLPDEVEGDTATEDTPVETLPVVEQAPPSEPVIDIEVESAASETLDPQPPVEPETAQAVEAAPERSPPVSPEPSSPPPVSPVLTSAATFYSPYAVRALGPLVGFGVRAAPRPAPAPAIAANDAPLVETVETSTEETPADLTPVEASAEALSTTAEPAPFIPSTDAAEPVEAAAAEADEPLQDTEASTAEPSLEPAPAAETADQPVAEPSAFEPPVQTPTFALPTPTPAAPAEVTLLALTGAPDDQTAPLDTRLVWPEHSDHAHPDQTPLFEAEETPVEQEATPETSARPIGPSFKFEWTETLTFLVMGGIGLLSFGAAMAAFRQSSQSNVDTGLIGWVLVVIALACVGVSGFNLYQRWGRVDRA